MNLRILPIVSKESFSLASEVLQLIKYSEHKWDVSDDFKMQSGYIQYYCFYAFDDVEMMMSLI